ncbi:MAG: dephospho-CoA kinase [Lachnospiraceae bacterium]|nr:dephospho-CoA kinase [Lachnospiraceae bacterium]
MKIIGITGGVGAGKSQILKYIKEHCNCKIVFADEVGNLVKEPGMICYQPLIELLGDKILNPDGTINKNRMAECIFSNPDTLDTVNGIIHPAVKEYIVNDIEDEKVQGKISIYFIEAALLIEDGYDKICDELWYIFAREEIRKQRLILSRGYSEEKIAQIIKMQRSEEEFRRYCKVVIDNSGEIEKSYEQIKAKLEEL